MNLRSRILTAGLLLTIPIAWAVLISVDSTRVVAAPDPDVPPPNTILHAVLVTALAVTTLLAAGTVGVLYLRLTNTKDHERQDRRIDDLANSLAKLVDAFAAHAEQATRDPWAPTEDTADLRRLIPVSPPIPPIVRATAPVLAGLNGRATSAPTAGQVVNMPPSTAADRSRRKRRRNGGPAPKNPAPGKGPDPVPETYLADMAEVYELGRKVEAERRRRGPSDPDPTT